jgi:hypothetical protein
MLASRIFLTHWLIHLARCCPGPDSRCSIRQMADCESLKTATFVTTSVCSVSGIFTYSRSPSLMAHNSASLTSIRPVQRWLRKAMQPSLCLHTAAAATLPSSDRDPSIHHTQTPTPTLAALSLAQRFGSFYTAVSSLSITVLTAGCSSMHGQRIIFASRPRSCSFLMNLHIGAPDMGWLFDSFCLEAFACACERRLELLLPGVEGYWRR